MKRNRKYLNGRYLMLPPDVMENELYQNLSGKTMWVLNRFYQKVKWKERKKRIARLRLGDILNNGEIIFTYKEANENHISDTTFDRAIKRLVELGFLKVMEADNSFIQTPSKYAISDQFKNPDFRAIKKKRILRRDLGFQKGNEYNPRLNQTVKNDRSSTVGNDRRGKAAQ